MKKILITILSICTLASCAQRKQSMIPYPKEYNNITAENYIENLVPKIEKYDNHSKYFIRPTQDNCIFEILVNDIPIYKEYSLEKIANPIEINNAILRSGVQTITVRMYPIGNLIKETYGSGDPVTTLQRNSNVAIKVVKYEAFNISDELEDEIVVMLHESPTNKHTGNFTGDGLPFYEYTFTFNATVPYEMEGWSNGENLTKYDKDELKKAVINYYNNVKKVYENSNRDLFAKINFGDILRIATSEYRDKSYLEKGWAHTQKGLDIKEKDFFNFEEGTEMQFFGNGKIVALKHPTQNAIDKRLKGKSAFGFLHKEDGRRKAKFVGLFLYLPKGASLDQLQMMR